jgi:hypothetical protein
MPSKCPRIGSWASLSSNLKSGPRSRRSHPAATQFAPEIVPIKPGRYLVRFYHLRDKLSDGILLLLISKSINISILINWLAGETVAPHSAGFSPRPTAGAMQANLARKAS